MSLVAPGILIFVLIAIAIRKHVPMQPRIWFIMLLGAAAVLSLGQISITQAWQAIDVNIIGFLLGAFIIGEALDQSGLIEIWSQQVFKRATHKAVFLLILIFVVGLSSALLMNDTLAIIATPLLIRIALKNHCSAQPYLLATAFSITIGSVMSPVGNPQNLLIAVQGHVSAPFISFFYHLAVPTLFNLLMAWLFIVVRYRRTLFDNTKIYVTTTTTPSSSFNINLCYISLIIMIVLVFLKVLLLNRPAVSLPLSLISLIASIPILVGHSKRSSIIKHIDWGTLIFFAAMFVLMKSVWDSGFVQILLHHFDTNLSHPAAILTVSIVMSQLISNVPFVALYLPLLVHLKSSTATLMLLAAGSTLAGNFLPIGAASNMIILQQADRQNNPGFSILEFICLGVPLGIINAFIYYWWLK